MIDINTIIGEKYGRLTIVSYSHRNTNYQKFFIAKCDCGKTVTINISCVKFGNTKSCGCLQVEVMKKTLSNANRTHGKSKLPEYRIWKGIKSRCFNKNNPAYEYYGGRGINVCERWVNSFENFIEDIGRRPSSKHSLDRHPDNNGNYEPSNCRWATMKEQCYNRRSNIIIEYEGMKMTPIEFSKFANVHKETVYRYFRFHSYDDFISHFTEKIKNAS